LGDWTLWALLLKITEVSERFGLLLSKVKVVCYFWTKNGTGLHFGRHFRKLIWSHCREIEKFFFGSFLKRLMKSFENNFGLCYHFKMSRKKPLSITSRFAFYNLLQLFYNC
jgi:hypothetical protein